jgi:CRISPR/Cas system-associated exonuclease Cas4 (RecB family)
MMTNPAKLAVVPDRETREKAGRFLDRVEQARALRNTEGAPATVDAPPASRFSEPKPLDPTAILSPSSVNQFAHDCQVKWFYKRVLGLPEKRSAALGLGSALHEAIAANFAQKLETREDLPGEGVTAIFRGALDKELDSIELDKTESAADLRACGEVMTRVYMAECAPRIQPAAVERPVQGLIGDVPVQGFIDVLDTTGAVIDLKTASKKPSGISAGYRVQVATYAILEPTASGRARLDTLTKTKTVGLHQQTLEVSESDRKQATRLYSIAREQMQSGLFIPNRSSHLCSRKYCSYWAQCMDEYGGEVS